MGFILTYLIIQLHLPRTYLFTLWCTEVEALENDSYQVDDDDGLTKEEYIEDLKELEEEGT
jgi:hypothetical protein